MVAGEETLHEETIKSSDFMAENIEIESLDYMVYLKFCFIMFERFKKRQMHILIFEDSMIECDKLLLMTI